MVQKISHIGIAVRYLDEQIPFYRDILGLELVKIETVEDQQVRTAMFKIGDTRIELLEATSEESPIARFLEKRGEGFHHIAYQVDNCETALQRLKNEGLRLIDQTPRKGAGGHSIAFVHPKSTFGVLTEITQEHEAQ
jgi:methylmalonyl-CoA/ethylmalonyl-CoA epimerase